MLDNMAFKGLLYDLELAIYSQIFLFLKISKLTYINKEVIMFVKKNIESFFQC